jgi:hypothetical protein
MAHVWMAQCLCPRRHAIAMVALEFESQAEAEAKLLPALRDKIAELLATGFNPWCGLCGAVQADWKHEVARTRFRTIDEALPEMQRLATEQALVALLYGDHGTTPPRAH